MGTHEGRLAGACVRLGDGSSVLRQARGSAVSGLRHHVVMNGDRIWTAAELEVLSPNERDAIVRAGFVTDPDRVSSELLERARRKADERIAATESTQANG